MYALLSLELILFEYLYYNPTVLLFNLNVIDTTTHCADI